MTIVAELKALIEAKGGDASKVNTIAEAVKVLTSLEGGESSNTDNGETPGNGESSNTDNGETPGGGE